MPSDSRLQRFSSTTRTLSAIIVLCMCAACSYQRNVWEGESSGDFDQTERQPQVNPQSMDVFAYERIVISDLPFEASNEIQISVGGQDCMDVALESENSVSCLVLPNCSSGAQEIVLRSGAEQTTLNNAFEFQSSGEPLMNGLLAIGGGWMAGARNGALYPEAQLTSIAAYVARQSGNCLPLPLAVGAGFPALTAMEDIDRSIGILGEAEIDTALEPFLSGEESIASRRADSGESALIAVPYISAGEEIDGVRLGSRAAAFERFVRNATDESIIDEILRRQPKFVLSDFELFTYSSHTDKYRGAALRNEDIEKQVGRFFDRLSALDNPPYLFVLNAPPLNIFPKLEYSELARYESIWINNAIYRNVLRANEHMSRKGLDERFFMIDLYSFVYNAALAKAPITLCGEDFPTLIENNEESDIIITDKNGEHQQVGFDLLEGFFSLDAYHPTATAAALVANLVIESINAELGPNSTRRLIDVELKPVDMADAITKDPLSPSNIQKEATRLDFFPLAEYQDDDGLPQLHMAHYCALQWGGNMPEYNRCPGKVTPLRQDDPPIMACDENIALRVFLKTGDKSKADWPIMAYNSGSGHFIRDMASTDAQGFADFVFRSGSVEEIDTLTFFSGEAFSELTITVVSSEKGM